MSSLRLLAGLASLLTFAPVAARAADSALDDGFVSTISPGLTPTSYPTFDTGTGAVNATALQSDGKILAGGNVSRYKTSGNLSALKRLLPTGELDTSFNPGGVGLAAAGGQPEINALLVDSEDRVYVGGTFTSYNGVARSCLLRLNPDGTLDESFNTSGLGGSNRFVYSFALQPDGKLLVVGLFPSVNGVARTNIARLNSDGTLDTSFTSAAYTTIIHCVAVQPDGKILIGGELGYIQHFSRLNADGSLDTSFVPALAQANGKVQRIVVLPDGRIVASGFLTLGAPVGTEAYLAAFRADGSLDTAFQANLGAGPNGWVGGDLKLQPDGTLLVAGIFNEWNGQPRVSVARLRLDGTLDPDFAPEPYSDNRHNYLTHFYSLSIQPDGKLVAGGWFHRVTDPEVETYNLTRFVNEFSATSPGAIRLLTPTATTAENAGSVTLQVSRFGGTSGAVSVQYATSTGGANGTATAGADYTTTTGTLNWAAGEGGYKTITIPILQDSAAESAETFTLTLSNPTGGATIPAANAKTVVTIRDDDSAPVLTAQPSSASLEQGSGFTLSVRYDSVLPVTIQWQRDPDGDGPLPFADIPTATNISYGVAVADPEANGGRYRAVLTNAKGSVTSSAATVAISVPAGSVVTTYAPAFSTSVIDSALLPDGRVLVLSGTGPRRLAATGADDATLATATFATPTYGTSFTSLHLLPDGKFLVGGLFDTVNGTARPNLARFLPDGAFDSSYTPALPSAAGGQRLYVASISPGADGKYYVGFMSGGGLRRYNADGSHDTAFTPPANLGSDLQGAVYAVRELPDGRLYVAAMMGRNGGGFTYQFLRLQANGTPDSTFTAPTLNWYVTGIDVLPDGRVAIVGRFATVNGVAAQRVALLRPDGSLDPDFNFSAGANGPVDGVTYRDGRLLVWGEFTGIADAPALRGLARLNLDGSRDTSFSIGDGANGTVSTANYTASGDIFIAGGFTSFKAVPRQRAALLVGNPHIGAIGFVPARHTLVETDEPLVLTLRRYGPADEAVSIRWATANDTAEGGADYTTASGTVSWAAGDAADKTIALTLLRDGAVEDTERFRVLLSEPSGPVTAAASATITLLDADTPVSFTTQPAAATTVTAGNNLALSAAAASPSPVSYQWHLNGVAIPGATSAAYAKTGLAADDAGLYTLVATNAAGSFTSAAAQVVVTPRPGAVAPGLAASRPALTGVTAIAPDALGRAYVGGTFFQPSDYPYLVRVNADLSLDTAYSPKPNNSVAALRLQPDGKLLVGGYFTQIGTQTANRLARLNPDGTLDTAFQANVGNTIYNGRVNQIGLLSDGRIVAVGSGLGATGFAHIFNPDGTLDTNISVNQQVLVVAVQPDDKIIVGGYFTNIAGSNSNRLARLNSDGTRDTTFSGSLGANVVYTAVVVDSFGRIFAGGSNLSNGAGLAHVSDTGTFASNLGTTATVNLAADANGKLLVVRAASLSRTKGSNPLPSLGANDFDSTFGVTFSGATAVAAVGPDGSIWVGGSFTAAADTPASGLIKLQGDPGDPGIVNQPARVDANAGATARLSVGAVGTGLSYQWFKGETALDDGGRISGATTPILTIAGLTVADDATYTVAVTGGSPETTLVSAPAKLNVLGAPSVAVSPASATPALGSTLVLAADVLAATPATYVWKRGGVTLIDGGRYSGSTTGVLTITGVNAADNGAYTLTVTNSLGSVSTTPATVTADAFAAAARDDATGWLRASNTNTQIIAFLPLPDGRTLVGGTGNAAGGAFLDRNGQSVNTGLAVLDAAGNLSATPAGSFRQVNALVPLPGGKILLAGYNSTTTGASAVNAVRLNADLTVDSTFAPASTNITYLAAHADAQGRVYLGGNFTNYNGQTGYNHLVRLNADGSQDTAFNPGLNGAVTRIRSLPDGRFYASGAFTTVSGQPAPSVVRFLADGRVDASFTAASAGIGTISALDVDTLGRVLVGGNGVRRLNPDGTLDSTFTVTANNAINALVALPDGKVLVGGYFTNIAGAAINRIARLNADGTRDTAFDVGAGFGTTGGVLVIAPDSIGRVWVGGERFTTYKGVASSAAGFAILQSEAPATLAFTRLPTAAQADFGKTLVLTAAATGNNGFTYRWLKDGALLSDGLGISGATTATLTLAGLAVSDAAAYSVRVTAPGGVSITSPAVPVAVGPVLVPPVLTTTPPAELTRDLGTTLTLTAAAKGALPLTYQWFHFGAPLADGSGVSGATTPTLTVTGLTFAQAGEYTLRVTNPDGVINTEPTVLTVERRPGGLASGPLGATTINGEVRAILRLADGSMLVGGNFATVTVNGVNNSRPRIARFLADGTLDPAFNPSFDGAIYALAQDSAGRVFVGGGFASVTFGSTTTNVTRVARLTSALALDTAFNTVAAGPNAAVYALAPTENGGVYVGGVHGFNKVGDTTVNRVVRLNANGSLDTAFNPSAVTNEVDVLLRRADGKLYVGGITGLMLLNANGTRDTAFTAEGTSFSVLGYALMLLPDGSLLAGGNGALPQNYLRRLNANTGAMLADYAAGHSSVVRALARQADGKLLSGSLGVLKRTDPATGSDDPGFGSFNNSINALAVDNSGRIWVGGSFNQYNGVSQSRLAILNGGAYEARNGLRSVQTLTFPAIANRTFGTGGNTVTLSATSSAGLTPVTFAVTSGPATVSGNTLTITGAGTITVTASQAGNDDFADATASQTFTVAKAAQTIDFAALTNKTITSPAFTLSATASSSLPVAFAVSGPATLGGDGKTVTLTGATGTVTVTASQPGDANYNAAPNIVRTFTVNDGEPQTITFAAIANRAYGENGNTVTLSATSSAGLTPVTFAVTSGPATVSGNTLTITGVGTITVTASHPGNSTYAAGSASRSFTVAKADQAITFAAPASKVVTSPAFDLTVSATSGLPVSLAITGPATLSGKTVTLTGATGTVTITATQAGDANHNPASPVSHSFEVTTGEPQTITFNQALPNVVASKAKPITLKATASSGLPVTFAVVSGPATVSGNKLSFTGEVGPVVVRAIQEGGTNKGIIYAPASFDRSFDVIAGPPTKTQKITLGTLPAKATYGDTLPLVATSDSGLPVEFEITGPADLIGDTLVLKGAGKVVVKATQPGDATYKPAAAVSRTITVAKAVLAVNFANTSRLVGKPNPAAFVIESYAGFVGTDTADTAAGFVAPVGVTKAVVSSPAGAYPITPKGGAAANYTFAPGAGSLTVEGFGGSYEALLVDDANAPLGKLEITVSANALTYTGVLNLASETAPITLRGALDATSGVAATGAFNRAANAKTSLPKLSLTFGLAGDTLTAALALDDAPALAAANGSRLFVQEVVNKKKLTAAWTGAHTLVLRDPVALDSADTRPLPRGAGSGSAVIAATGVLTLKGALADDAKLTATAKADAQGRYRLFVRPYAKRANSVLSGPLALVEHPDQTRFPDRYYVPADQGLLYWSKALSPTKPLDKSYRLGFDADVTAALDPWLAPSAKAVTVNGVTVAPGTLAQRLGLAATATDNGGFSVAFPGAPDLGARASFLPTELLLNAKGAVSVPLPLPAKADNPAFTLKVTPATGAFTGSFTLADTPEVTPPAKPKTITRKVTFTGTLRQTPEGDTVLGAGSFLLPDLLDKNAEQPSFELRLSPAP